VASPVGAAPVVVRRFGFLMLNQAADRTLGAIEPAWNLPMVIFFKRAYQGRLWCHGDRIWSDLGADRDRFLGGHKFRQPFPQPHQNLQHGRRPHVRCPLVPEWTKAAP
jgi:hypothetical protein